MSHLYTTNGVERTAAGFQNVEKWLAGWIDAHTDNTQTPARVTHAGLPDMD